MAVTGRKRTLFRLYEIEFNTGKYASDHCLRGSQSLAWLHLVVDRETAHFGAADHLIFAMSAKIVMERDELFAYLGYL